MKLRILLRFGMVNRELRLTLSELKIQSNNKQLRIKISDRNFE